MTTPPLAPRKKNMMFYKRYSFKVLRLFLFFFFIFLGLFLLDKQLSRGRLSLVAFKPYLNSWLISQGIQTYDPYIRWLKWPYAEIIFKDIKGKRENTLFQAKYIKILISLKEITSIKNIKGKNIKILLDHQKRGQDPLSPSLLFFLEKTPLQCTNISLTFHDRDAFFSYPPFNLSCQPLQKGKTIQWEVSPWQKTTSHLFPQNHFPFFYPSFSSTPFFLPQLFSLKQPQEKTKKLAQIPLLKEGLQTLPFSKMLSSPKKEEGDKDNIFLTQNIPPHVQPWQIKGLITTDHEKISKIFSIDNKNKNKLNVTIQLNNACIPYFFSKKNADFIQASGHMDFFLESPFSEKKPQWKIETQIKQTGHFSVDFSKNSEEKMINFQEKDWDLENVHRKNPLSGLHHFWLNGTLSTWEKGKIQMGCAINEGAFLTDMITTPPFLPQKAKDKNPASAPYWRGQIHIKMAPEQPFSPQGESGLLLDTLFSFWPPKVAESTRSWLFSHFHQGLLSHISLNGAVNWLDPLSSSSSKDTWQLIHLEGNFNLNQGHLTFLKNLHPIQNLKAQVSFTPHTFNIQVKEGLFNAHKVSGILKISQIPSQPLLSMDLTLNGPFATLLPTLMIYGETGPLPLFQIKGQAKTQIKSHFPLLSDLALKDIHLELESHITQGAFNIQTGHKPLKVTQANFKIKNITSPIQKNNVPTKVFGKGLIENIHISWQTKGEKVLFTIWPNARDAEKITGIDFSSLVTFPLAIKGYHLQGKTVLSSDLTARALDIPLLLWKKPPGKPLTLSCMMTEKTYLFHAKGAITAEGTLHFSPSATRKKETKALTEIPHHTLPQKSTQFLEKGYFSLVLPGCHMKYALNAENKQRHHRLFLRADRMNLLPYPLLKNLSEKKQTTHLSPSTNNSAKAQGDFFWVDFACNHIFMKGVTLSETKGFLQGRLPSFFKREDIKKAEWHHMEIFSYLSKNAFVQENAFPTQVITPGKEKPSFGHLSCSLTQDGHQQKNIQVNMSNIGTLLKGLGWTSRLKDGDFTLNLAGDEKRGYEGDVLIKKLTLKDTSLAKFIALASPAMFIELFSSGVQFEEVFSKVHYQDGFLTLNKGVAKNFNLGILTKGRIDLSSYNLRLKGVIIPGYFLNAFFKNFPMVGAFFGGKKGIISSEFLCTGSLERPIFKLKPLSLLKIGFLRKLLKSFKRK